MTPYYLHGGTFYRMPLIIKNRYWIMVQFNLMQWLLGRAST